MTALEWLTQVADHPTLSSQAKQVAALMSDGWTGSGGRCKHGVKYVLDNSKLVKHDDVHAAAKELRAAGFITGRGMTSSHWKLHDPQDRLPLVEELDRERAKRHVARELDLKLRIVLNGGTHA